MFMYICDSDKIDIAILFFICKNKTRKNREFYILNLSPFLILIFVIIYLLVLLFIHNNCGGKDINITSLSLVQFFEIFRSTYLFLNSNKEIQIYLKKHFVLKNLILISKLLLVSPSPLNPCSRLPPAPFPSSLGEYGIYLRSGKRDPRCVIYGAPHLTVLGPRGLPFCLGWS